MNKQGKGGFLPFTIAQFLLPIGKIIIIKDVHNQPTTLISSLLPFTKSPSCVPRPSFVRGWTHRPLPLYPTPGFCHRHRRGQKSDRRRGMLSRWNGAWQPHNKVVVVVRCSRLWPACPAVSRAGEGRAMITCGERWMIFRARSAGCVRWAALAADCAGAISV